MPPGKAECQGRAVVWLTYVPPQLSAAADPEGGEGGCWRKDSASGQGPCCLGPLHFHSLFKGVSFKWGRGPWGHPVLFGGVLLRPCSAP